MISAERIMRNKNITDIIIKKQKCKVKETAELQQLEQFFFDDEITTQSPNKKYFLTLKGEKKLKRYLNDTLLNLHKQFMIRFDKKMSFPTFLKYKPHYVVYMKCDARNTCACVKHLNL